MAGRPGADGVHGPGDPDLRWGRNHGPFGIKMLAGDGPVFADDRLDGMVLLRVDARPLLPGLRAELTGLLAGLSGADWERPTACPGWPVHGVAAHLLGVERDPAAPALSFDGDEELAAALGGVKAVLG
jgi:hypothetical protein